MSSAAADHVGVEEQERLDIAAVARKVVELLLVETARDGLAIERDVVDRIGRDGDRFVDAADGQGDVHQSGAGRAQDNARSLEFLEVRRHDLDPVGPGFEVCRFVAALRIGLDRAGHAGRLVDDQHRRAGHDAALGIDDRAPDGTEERLRHGWCGHGVSHQEHEEREKSACDPLHSSSPSTSPGSSARKALAFRSRASFR